jgi:hypothetical protein
VNLLKNSIPVEQAQELVKIMRAKENLTTLCGLSKKKTELDFSGQRLGAGDAVLIANDISDMGAILVLNLANNNFGQVVGWYLNPKYASSERIGLDWTTGNGECKYKHSDGRQGRDKLPEEGLGKPEGVVALANAIPDMRAISQFTFSGGNKNSKPVTMEISMTEADFSAKGLGEFGVVMVAAFLPKCT